MRKGPYRKARRTQGMMAGRTGRFGVRPRDEMMASCIRRTGRLVSTLSLSGRSGLRESGQRCRNQGPGMRVVPRKRGRNESWRWISFNKEREQKMRICHQWRRCKRASQKAASRKGAYIRYYLTAWRSGRTYSRPDNHKARSFGACVRSKNASW